MKPVIGLTFSQVFCLFVPRRDLWISTSSVIYSPQVTVKAKFLSEYIFIEWNQRHN